MVRATAFTIVAIFAALQVVSPVSAAIDWSTAYSQTNAVTNQLRAVAVAKQIGNDSVYTGFIQTTGSPGNRDVKRFDTNAPYGLLNARGLSGDQPKAIATDDFGNVFVGNRISGGSSAKITVHNATLSTSADTSVASDQFGGLATVVISGQYYLYASRESGKEIRRYTYNPASAGSSIAIDTTFGVSGVFTLSAATSGVLRGLEVESDGTIYVTSRDDGRVYRVSPDLSTTISAPVIRAMDVDTYNGDIYVTSYNGTLSQIAVFDADDLTSKGSIVITTLDAVPYVRGSGEGFSAIDIDALGRIWMGDQAFQTSGTTSDRLLVSDAAVPEPASFGLALLGVVGVAMRRRK